MIYLTGDTHGDFTRFSKPRFPEQKDMTKDDIVIILGDFGGIWNWFGESPREKWWLDWLNDKPFTTCFVDGNHECFPRLYSYPETIFHGGNAHKIKDSVFHLMRGNIFNFEDKKFFCMGGARSHDIKDGIFDIHNYGSEKLAKDAVKRWYKSGKEFRIRGMDWWDDEIPTDAELAKGRQELDKVDWQVDYVLTHCLPQQAASYLGYRQGDYLTSYLDGLIDDGIKFTKWYCGHYHQEKSVWVKFVLKYYNIERIL